MLSDYAAMDYWRTPLTGKLRPGTSAANQPKAIMSTKQITALKKSIEALQIKLADLEGKLSTAELEFAETQKLSAAREAIEVTGLPPGTEVTFEFGRKENKKTYTGTVLAFRAAVDTLPSAYKITVGAGFDAEIKTVPARDVAVAGAEQEVAADVAPE